MAGTLTPAWFLYFTDDEGAPLVDGEIYTYITGTDTLTPVYHDADLLNPWSNPITIPADGKVTMYQDANTIKAKVFDADGNLLATYDPIQSTALDVTTGGSVFTFGGDDSFPIVVTALPSGVTVAALHPGTSFFTVDSNTLIGDYILQGMMQAGAGEIVTASLVNISQGSPDTPIVSMSSISTAGELNFTGVIPWATGGVARTYAIKTKTTSGIASYVWSLALVRTT